MPQERFRAPQIKVAQRPLGPQPSVCKVEIAPKGRPHLSGLRGGEEMAVPVTRAGLLRRRPTAPSRKVPYASAAAGVLRSTVSRCW